MDCSFYDNPPKTRFDWAGPLSHYLRFNSQNSVAPWKRHNTQCLDEHHTRTRATGVYHHSANDAQGTALHNAWFQAQDRNISRLLVQLVAQSALGSTTVMEAKPTSQDQEQAIRDQHQRFQTLSTSSFDHSTMSHCVQVNNRLWHHYLGPPSEGEIYHDNTRGVPWISYKMFLTFEMRKNPKYTFCMNFFSEYRCEFYYDDVIIVTSLILRTS